MQYVLRVSRTFVFSKNFCSLLTVVYTYIVARAWILEVVSESPRRGIAWIEQSLHEVFVVPTLGFLVLLLLRRRTEFGIVHVAVEQRRGRDDQAYLGAGSDDPGKDPAFGVTVVVVRSRDSGDLLPDAVGVGVPEGNAGDVQAPEVAHVAWTRDVDPLLRGLRGKA